VIPNLGKFENRPLGSTISNPQEISARSNPVSQFQEVPRGDYRCPVVAVGYSRRLQAPTFQNS
jgi:hypothetical protein